MYRQTYLTQAQIENLICESSDEEETATLIRHADHVDFIVLPPPQVDELSDVEGIDEDDQILNDRSAFIPGEVAGEIEVACDYDDCNRRMPDCAETDDIMADNECDDAAAAGPSKPKKKKTESYTAKWSKSKKISFSRAPVNVEREKVAALFEKYGSLL